MTFRIFLSLTLVTCLVKMSSVFFQAIGKPISAMISSMIRDILCFTPLAIFLPQILEKHQAGSGIHGILYAAPISDAVAAVVVVKLIVSFFRQLNQEMAQMECQTGETVAVPASEAVIKPSRSGAIITISREHGTGGNRIGKLVAGLMGIPYYYRTTEALAAQESGLNQGFLEDLNTNAPAFLHQLYMNTNAVQQAMVAQEKIIQSIADNGSCVIMGRAADHVLKDYDKVIRIFIYGSEEYCVKNIMEGYGDTREQAEEHMRRSNAARAAYYRTISGKVWGDPHNYDLCVDASIGHAACARLIYNYIKSRQE